MASIEEAQGALLSAIVSLAKKAEAGGTTANVESASAGARNLAVAHRLLSKEPVDYDVADSIR